MRIIGGRYKGKIIRVPVGLPVRPTTDFAKEGLFNILYGKVDFEQCNVLDLFSGTGHISMEFSSRGSSHILAVDKDVRCCRFLTETADEMSMKIKVIKSDVFKFLHACELKFNLVFADPPYDLNNIPVIHELVFSRSLLSADGILIIEHGIKTDLSALQGFQQRRKYGNVNFSFFKASL